ncbi:MAG: molybdenum cofactor guanylyltransferase MobA [Paracoccaceae bacterium]
MAVPPGVILAGGRARRMGGGDKGLQMLAGQTLLARITARLGPQVCKMALSANGPAERFAGLGLPVLPDSVGAGPLAGILAGMDWAAARGDAALITVPGDTPFLPADLVMRLQGAGFAMAASGGVLHPTFGLWPVDLRDALRDALSGGMRRVREFAQAHGAGTVDFPDEAAFFNINTPQDLIQAEAMLAR